MWTVSVMTIWSQRRRFYGAQQALRSHVSIISGGGGGGGGKSGFCVWNLAKP
jgi:hypothetical protein